MPSGSTTKLSNFAGIRFDVRARCALMFDIVTQNHSIGSVIEAAILADFSQLAPNDPEAEVAKMRIIASARCCCEAGICDDVHVRKLTIANGTGTVHGLGYDLADMYCITLNP